MSLPGGGGLDLRGVLLAAIMLGSVGVLDDVTVTQAVLVDELSAKGNLRGPALALSAMRIGRSHIGATVNTLFLAYISVGLPLLIVLFVSHQPSAAILNQESIATELVRTLVGSLGIIAAIPLTTFIAGGLVTTDRGFGTRRAGLERRALVRVGLAAAGVVLLLGIATAITVSGSPRSALTPDTFTPKAGLGATPGPAPSADAGASTGADAGAPGAPASHDAIAPSDTPGSSPLQDGLPTLYDQAEAVPLAAGGQAVGTVAVRATRRPSPTTVATDAVSVELRYAATIALPLDAGRWVLLINDGTEVELLPVDDHQPGGTLAAGNDGRGASPRDRQSCSVGHLRRLCRRPELDDAGRRSGRMTQPGRNRPRGSGTVRDTRPTMSTNKDPQPRWKAVPTTLATTDLEIHPLTSSRFSDLAALFERRPSPVQLIRRSGFLSIRGAVTVDACRLPGDPSRLGPTPGSDGRRPAGSPTPPSCRRPLRSPSWWLAVQLRS